MYLCSLDHLRYTCTQPCVDGRSFTLHLYSTTYGWSIIYATLVLNHVWMVDHLRYTCTQPRMDGRSFTLHLYSTTYGWSTIYATLVRNKVLMDLTPDPGSILFNETTASVLPLKGLMNLACLLAIL